jgi:hypothetical protein
MNANNSLTDVANAALALLGQSPITSIDSNDSAARSCRAHLDAVLREEQQRFPWSELRTVADLAQTVHLAAQAQGWTAFAKPGNLLQVVSWSAPVVFRDGVVLAQVPALSAEYIKFSETVAEWSPELFRVVAGALAAAIARVMTGNEKLAQQLEARLIQVTRPEAYRAQQSGTGPQNWRENDSEYRNCYGR